MEKEILPQLTDYLQGLLYFSESEATLTVQDLGYLPKEQLNNEIAVQNNVNPETIKSIDPTDFFEGILKTADPADDVIIENAQKFQELYSFLKSNYTDIQVHRIEGDTKIPLIITALQPDNSCIAISTYAIES